MKQSFDNTEVAFASKSDKDLRWTYRMFKAFGKNWLVNLGDFGQKIAFALRLPIKGIIKRTIFKQFCGGETIDECEPRIKELEQYNVGAILDYSVEGKYKEDDLDEIRDEIIATIHKARDFENIPFAVFKPTGICRTGLLEKVNVSEEKLNAAEKIEWEAVKNRFEAICKAAYEAGVPVFIDAEDSWFQDAIDQLAEEMMLKYNQERGIVYNTLQMYRHDRLDFLHRSHKHAQENGYILGIKLVRGAYMEKERERAREMEYEDPIQPNREATHTDFNSAMLYMIQHIDQIHFCAGTHNEYSCMLLADLLEQYNLKRGDKRVYFAQLLGMSDHISFNLSEEGYNVVKYVPYGPVKEVMPYLMRRAKENTSVAGQMSRELSLIVKEMERRKIMEN
ncbi:MAG: proline dehydrogenase family protein [Crocinitomicaceae bacterium]